MLGTVPARQGHFLLESGYHSSLWLDLDGLFVESERIAPLVSELARALRPHRLQGVCGPLLGGAFLAQLVALELGLEFYFTEQLPPEGEGLYRARYLLRTMMRERVRGKRLAIVDDVMSAGSAARATYAELGVAGARPVAVRALLLLGTTGADFFREAGVPVEAAAQLPFDHWHPSECPLCQSAVPLEQTTPASGYFSP